MNQKADRPTVVQKCLLFGATLLLIVWITLLATLAVYK